MGALDGTKLFGRSISLVVADPNAAEPYISAEWDSQLGLDLSGLNIEFVVEKSIKAGEYNTCAIRVFNLAPHSREKVSGAKSLTVKLDAGYAGGTSQLYFAGARSAWSTREGATLITHIESMDTIARPTGVKGTKKIDPSAVGGSVYRTTGAFVSTKDAVVAIAKMLGVSYDAAQLDAVLSQVPLQSINGSAIVGNGAKRLTDLCRSAGLEWSIQDGVLQFLNIGDVLGGKNSSKAINLSADTGLVGSPAVDSQGVLSLTTLLIPGLAPGVLIVMDSEFAQGGYRIEKIRFAGSTAGQEWYAHINAVRY